MNHHNFFALTILASQGALSEANKTLKVLTFEELGDIINEVHITYFNTPFLNCVECNFRRLAIKINSQQKQDDDEGK